MQAHYWRAREAGVVPSLEQPSQIANRSARRRVLQQYFNWPSKGEQLQQRPSGYQAAHQLHVN